MKLVSKLFTRLLRGWLSGDYGLCNTLEFYGDNEPLELCPMDFVV